MIIPAGTSSVDIPMEIVDDVLVERTEYLSIIFLSRVSGLDIGGELPIANNRFNVAIHDNDGKAIVLYSSKNIYFNSLLQF